MSADENGNDYEMVSTFDIETVSSSFVPKSSINPSLLYMSNLQKFQTNPYVFVIEGQTFTDNNLELSYHTCDEYVEFELYAQKCIKEYTDPKGLVDDGAYFWSPPQSDDDSESLGAAASKFLNLKVTELVKGVIINSQLYLTRESWNTILSEDLDFRECFVCNELIEIEDDGIGRHIGCRTHRTNLNEHKPLTAFDLNITRMIRQYYHCAVCNDLLSDVVVTDHHQTDSHADKLLRAVSKASKLTEKRIYKDFPKYACRKKSRKKNKSRKNDGAIKDCDSDNDSSDEFIEDNACATKSSQKTYSSYAGAVKNEMENDNDSNRDIGNSNDFAVGNFSGNDFFWNSIMNGDAYFNEKDKDLSGKAMASYAEMAKTEETPKFVTVEYSKGNVEISYESFHMIIKPKLNRFYCMICIHHSHIMCKKEHCESETHMRKLLECNVIETRHNVFVRQICDKYYHCGECNNLEVIDRIDNHIEKNHPRLARNCSERAN